MAINFTDSPADGATQVISGRTYTYNSAKNKWDTTATEVAGPTATVYATVNDLPGTATTGDQAFVSGTNRLYIWNGSGWYNIALVNSTPTWSIQPDSSYTLASDGTATTITIVAVDPEGLPITYSIASDTSGNIATVTSNNNVFTITPSTNTADAGSFSLTFRASDGVNIASAISEFTLAFIVNNSHYTTALITSVGTNNQVNNTFVDSSSNSHTITTVGNATQTTFSPYRHGGYSIYCDGANVMNLGFSTLNSGNWTFECWARVEVGETILGKYGGGNQLEAFGVSNTTGYMYTHTNVGVETPTCNTDLRDGKWHYLVWERYNGTYYYWADGSLETSFANSETPGATGNWGLGGVASGRFKGNIKEARFSLSTAVYSGSAPTTPTEPQTTSNATDAFFTGVGLEIKDYSSNNRTFTVPSTFELAPTTPYDYETYSAADNGGSMYFDGTGDRLTFSHASDFSFGTGDFTIEFWIKTPTNAITGGYSRTICEIGQFKIYLRITQYHGGTDGALLIYDGSTGVDIGGTVSLSDDRWHHVAVVRESGTAKCWVDGAYMSGVSHTTSLTETGTNAIGAQADGNGSLQGTVADLRVVKGTAVYTGTSNFTPPTAPLTAITNTSLLLSGTNAGIIDKSQTAKTLTLNGNVKSSTTQTKYLTSSMYFDGTGDAVSSGLSAELGTVDFTLEAWIYPTTLNSNDTIIAEHWSGTTAGFILRAHTSNYLSLFDGTTNRASSTAIVTNQWQHVAASRENGTLKLFIDGTQVLSVATSSSLSGPGSGESVTVGAITTSSGFSNYFTGYISDARITKGLARYTANFTPPTVALQG